MKNNIGLECWFLNSVFLPLPPLPNSTFRPNPQPTLVASLFELPPPPMVQALDLQLRNITEDSKDFALQMCRYLLIRDRLFCYEIAGEDVIYKSLSHGRSRRMKKRSNTMKKMMMKYM